ncbi:hypothetical protein [Vibrio mangrovi]|uniref:Uncharacterized protein n=1 Tax=Vibrio mangrovi TaxID=474394 RepID=A0A1Y6ITL0_9VIBR|nr:hypothetical protein [Vibrio mangrovi]MDW6004728.1 hypothetical protein [Vibrio mangrovi]SMS01019.1 hypothetical protein VIM7927_02296 [Vibrio mangrovi]
MRDLNEILDDVVRQFRLQYPQRVVTRNWQDRSAYADHELAPGILTLVYTGERPVGNVYATEIYLRAIGRLYCGAQASGIDVERQELEFLKQWRDFCSSAAVGNITIQSVATSQQKETPDGWFTCECIAGQYDLGSDLDWLPEGPANMPDKIFASQKPDIGQDHRDDYFPVSENENE